MKRGVAVAVLVAAAACTGRTPTAPSAPVPPPPSQPPPGLSGLTVALSVQDTTAVGLVIVTLKGPHFGTIKVAATDYVLFSRNPSAQEVRLIVVGNLATGSLLTITGDSLQAPAMYAATLEQVVNRSDHVQSNLSDFALTISKSGP